MPKPVCPSPHPRKDVEPDVANLTNGERLMLARRRAGKTQEGLRDELGISKLAYLRLEHDAKNANWVRWMDDNRTLLALVRSIDHVELHERCVLSRLRQEMTQSDLAKQAGCSKQWVQAMETAKQRCDTLLDFWARFWAAKKS